MNVTLPQLRLLMSLPALLLAVTAVDAQSIWQHRCPPYSHVFFDTNARVVGDLVTVVIRENTDVENRDQRQSDRTARSDGGFGFNYGFGGQFGSKTGSSNFDVETNGSGSFDGQSQYTVEREFIDMITCTVVGCLPNGNLIIRGERDRMVSGERRALTVTGIVRAMDIMPDNSIESKYVSNFRVCYNGDGIDSRFTKQGWLTNAWNKFRPL